VDQWIARADHDIKSLSPATKFCLKDLSPATKNSTQLGVRHMRHMRHAHFSTPAFLRCKIKNENKIFCQYPHVSVSHLSQNNYVQSRGVGGVVVAFSGFGGSK
jgi:hypothetical protein